MAIRTIAAIVVMAISVGVLIGGWIFHSDLLIRIAPSFAGLVPSTAIALLLISVALLVPERAAVRLVAASAVAIIAASDLVVIGGGFANGIDAFLFPDVAGFQIHSMAAATAFCCLLASACLGFLWQRDAEFGSAYSAFATLGLTLALTAIVGYAFDTEALYKVSIFSAMALHTALAFLAVFTALLVSKPHLAWISILLGQGSGSAGARRLFPVVFLGPFVLCLIALAATNAGLLDANFRLSMLAIVIMALLAASVIGNAAIQNNAERELRVTVDQLRTTVADRDLLLREVYHRVKNNLQQINALIHMEVNRLSDPAAKASLRSTTGRVQALAMVHTLLVSSEKPSKIETDIFLKDLCTHIARLRRRTT